MSKVRNEWVKTKDKIGEFSAIKHKITGELSLSGRHGEVWEHSPGVYRAVIKPGLVQNIVLRYLSLPCRGSKLHERVVGFTRQHLAGVVKRLKIPLRSGDQIKYANTF